MKKMNHIASKKIVIYEKKELSNKNSEITVITLTNRQDLLKIFV